MKHLIIISILSIVNGAVFSQSLPPKSIPFKKTGMVIPRHAKEIEGSDISIGAEMMDRDYTVYNNWKSYLGPLGAKKARIQSGWAKVERQKGVYDWSWLDEIVFDMVDQGVEPWINLSYGNTIYQGGGGTTLKQKQLPDSQEALKAWQLFVRGTVARYKDVVDEWEIWNEPNYEIDFNQYADFFILTAETIKEIQPEGKVLAFALGSGVDYRFAEKALNVIHTKGKIHLIDQITHHRHIDVPEVNESEVKLSEVVVKFSDKIIIRQGEAGCPVGLHNQFAMKGKDWTELQQAKHILRRLMTDLGRGKETSVFTMIDAAYIMDNKVVWNRKGLLKADNDKKVEGVRPSYRTVQTVTSVFDHDLKRIPGFQYETDAADALYVFAHQNINSGKQAVVVWFGNNVPSNENAIQKVSFRFPEADFDEPVFVDLRTGDVFSLPESHWKRKGNAYQFKNIPVYDSPVMIADKSLIKLDQ